MLKKATQVRQVAFESKKLMAHSNAVANSSGEVTPSKVGAQMLELFASKVLLHCPSAQGHSALPLPHCPVPSARYSLLPTHYPLRTTHQTSPTTHHAPHTTHHAPRTTHHAARITHFTLRTTHHEIRTQYWHFSCIA